MYFLVGIFFRVFFHFCYFFLKSRKTSFYRRLAYRSLGVFIYLVHSRGVNLENGKIRDFPEIGSQPPGGLPEFLYHKIYWFFFYGDPWPSDGHPHSDPWPPGGHHYNSLTTWWSGYLVKATHPMSCNFINLNIWCSNIINGSTHPMSCNFINLNIWCSTSSNSMTTWWSWPLHTIEHLMFNICKLNDHLVVMTSSGTWTSDVQHL